MTEELNKRLDGITYIDVAHLMPPLTPFWMLVRWDHINDDDLTTAEREETKAAGVTDFDDFSIGICFNRKEDALAVAARMADRFDIPFAVISDTGDIDGETS
jgi:hypothetical protein